MLKVPSVSVVIPAFNQSQYLSAAIESVLTQTYRDYEIIVVDDGSTDRTPEVAQSYGSVIRYVWQENRGLAAARNTGIRLAQGEYVAFLDSDDCWLPPYLHKMMALAAKNPEATVYYCGARVIDSDDNLLPQVIGQEPVPVDKMYFKMLRMNPLVPSAVVVRRTAIVRAGLFDPAFRRLQDRELWVRLLKSGHRFIGHEEPLILYRLHDENLSRDYQAGRQAVLALTEKHFGGNCDSPELWNIDKRRAYGGAYLSCALLALVYQGDRRDVSRYLVKALESDPTLATDLNLFYELALGAQPRGYRGSSAGFDIDKSRNQVEELLSQVFGDSSNGLTDPLRREVYGTAYYALGLVAYNMGKRSAAGSLFRKALPFRRGLLMRTKFTFTFVKTLFGDVWFARLRRIRHLITNS